MHLKITSCQLSLLLKTLKPLFSLNMVNSSRICHISRFMVNCDYQIIGNNSLLSSTVVVKNIQYQDIVGKTVTWHFYILLSRWFDDVTPSPSIAVIFDLSWFHPLVCQASLLDICVCVFTMIIQPQYVTVTVYVDVIAAKGKSIYGELCFNLKILMMTHFQHHH